MTDTLELADVIKALRDELTTAKIAGVGKDIRFTVNNVEIELETVVTKEKNAELGMKFWVVDAKAVGKYQNAFKQKIKLSLKPITPDGKELEVGKTVQNPD
jgi:hypothetical protein